MSPEDLTALSRVDLNLLRSFDALVSERSVTLAAARLSVSQPAMSAALGRLRRLYGDPLLVREGAGLVPTPVAEALHEPVIRALQTISSTMHSRREFDPATHERTFRLIASDHVILVLLKPLLRALRTEAPGVRLHVLPMAADFVGQVRRNQVDLAVAPHEGGTLPGEVRGQDLLTDRFVCAVAADHPAVGDTLILEQLKSCPHLVHEDGSSSVALRRALRAQGIDDDVEVRTQSFVLTALMLEGTELIGMLPSRLAHSYAERARIRVLEPPVDLPDLTETLYWRARDHDEPAQAWLRRRLLQAAREVG